MKRLITFMMAISMAASMAACGNTPAATEPEVAPNVVMTENTAAPGAGSMDSAEGAVEITMDNWETYFELRSVSDPFIGESGKAEGRDFMYGVFLKPEYAEKFDSGMVNFEISYDLVNYNCTVDGESYTLGDKLENDLESAFETKTFGLQDFREDPEISDKSAFFGQVAGVVYGGSAVQQEDGQFIASVPENGKILNAEGSLTLK